MAIFTSSGNKPAQPAAPKKKLTPFPDLAPYAIGPAPDGYKVNPQFVQKRERRRTILLTDEMNTSLEQLAKCYKLSTNSLIFSVLNRFIDEYSQIYYKREKEKAAAEQAEKEKQS